MPSRAHQAQRLHHMASHDTQPTHLQKRCSPPQSTAKTSSFAPQSLLISNQHDSKTDADDASGHVQCTLRSAVEGRDRLDVFIVTLYRSPRTALEWKRHVSYTMQHTTTCWWIDACFFIFHIRRSQRQHTKTELMRQWDRQSRQVSRRSMPCHNNYMKANTLAPGC